MKRLALMLAMLIASCAAPKVAQDYQRDSIITIIRDTTIFRDSIVYVTVEADDKAAILPDIDTSYLATNYAESKAYVADGLLFHSIRNKSNALIPVNVTIPFTLHTEQKHSISDRAKTEIVEVEKELGWWQQTVLTVGYVCIALLLIFVLIKVFKTYIRL